MERTVRVDARSDARREDLFIRLAPLALNLTMIATITAPAAAQSLAEKGDTL